MAPKTEPHVERAARTLNCILAEELGVSPPVMERGSGLERRLCAHVRRILRAAGRGGKELMRQECYAIYPATSMGAISRRPYYRRIIVLDAGKARARRDRHANA